MAATKKTTATTKTTAAKSTTKTTATKATATKTATKTCAKSASKTTAKKEPVVKAAEITVQGKRNILFVASEATPFIQTGGLAEVVGSLSTALAATGKFDVRVILPLYSDIKKEYREKFTYLGNLYVHLAWRNQYCGVFSYVKDGVTFYFVDNEFYFKRPGCYGYFDDGERFAFFSRAVLEIIPFVKFYPEVMHCHDWQAALAAIYLKTNYCFRPEYQFIRCLFTIHNIEYQGQYSLDILSSLFDIYGKYQYLVEYNNSINLMKGAIEVSERFSTVSPRYADEIKDPYYAHGLDPIIRNNQFKLKGILNGIDDKGYNSELDTHLFKNFTPDDMSGKAVCKAELQKMLNLPVKPDTPVIAMISRLVSHKGLDLVTNVIEEILRDDVQFVLLGTGDYQYESYFRELAKKYPEKVSANIQFNGDLSRKIYSGADIFLMPSKSEPCGLSQMMACRYGTVPIVRETGGLYDSIKPQVNGYTFANYNAHDMLYVVRQALADYKNKEKWAELRYRAITSDFSWKKSAKEYETLYLDMLK
ncbi:MAG: glycogen synthase [Candidatus Coproplasma sp.]